MTHLNSAVKLLDRAAEKFNDKIAISDEWSEISFSELQRKGKAVGTALAKTTPQGYMPAPVMVYLKKSISCLVCFMGAMYSANPYVPTAYDMPANRIQKIVDSLQGRGHIITDAQGMETLKTMNIPESMSIHIYEEIVETETDGELIEKTLNSVIDTDPIYIMFTSGSTGAPKGVTVPHRGVIDYAIWVAKTFNINENSILGNQAPFYFDNSIFDIYSCLLTGAKMVIIPETLFMFPVKLPEFVRDNDITTIFWVPTVMINVANSGVLSEIELPKLKNVVFCGEVMPNTQLNIWRKYLPDCMYVNMYGPTEATDIATYYIVDREYENHETLPIGKVCRNMRALILNDDDKQCAVGEQGELCISGTGIALGYWNSPEITAKAFVQNPLNTKYHDRIYRTGDLVYENEEGNIIFIGRKDSQIKLRGNRIELGDLESAAAAIENVASACALFDADKQEIVLFIETTAEIVARKFKMKLKKYVPAYMVPGKIVTMEKFPHTPSGKIDRVGLRKTYITAE